MAEAWRRRRGAKTVSAELGGQSAYRKAPEVISRGSWMPCTPSLGHVVQFI